jgi:hypothetical protein
VPTTPTTTTTTAPTFTESMAPLSSSSPTRPQSHAGVGATMPPFESAARSLGPLAPNPTAAPPTASTTSRDCRCRLRCRQHHSVAVTAPPPPTTLSAATTARAQTLMLRSLLGRTRDHRLLPLGSHHPHRPPTSPCSRSPSSPMVPRATQRPYVRQRSPSTPTWNSTSPRPSLPRHPSPMLSAGALHRRRCGDAQQPSPHPRSLGTRVQPLGSYLVAMPTKALHCMSLPTKTRHACSPAEEEAHLTA